MADESTETTLGAEVSEENKGTEGAETGSEVTEGATPGEGTEEGAKEGGEEGAPAEYAQFMGADGKAIEGNGLIEKFAPAFRELNLTQEAAQKLVTLYEENRQAAESEAEGAFETTMREWADTAAKDGEFGGAKWEATQSAVRNVVQRFGTNELRVALNETGMGNHPELIRFAYRISQAIAEDTAHHEHGGGGSATVRKPTEDILYDKR